MPERQAGSHLLAFHSVGWEIDSFSACNECSCIVLCSGTLQGRSDASRNLVCREIPCDEAAACWSLEDKVPMGDIILLRHTCSFDELKTQ